MTDPVKTLCQGNLPGNPYYHPDVEREAMAQALLLAWDALTDEEARAKVLSLVEKLDFSE